MQQLKKQTKKSLLMPDTRGRRQNIILGEMIFQSIKYKKLLEKNRWKLTLLPKLEHGVKSIRWNLLTIRWPWKKPDFTSESRTSAGWVNPYRKILVNPPLLVYNLKNTTASRRGLELHKPAPPDSNAESSLSVAWGPDLCSAEDLRTSGPCYLGLERKSLNQVKNSSG